MAYELDAGVVDQFARRAPRHPCRRPVDPSSRDRAAAGMPAGRPARPRRAPAD